MSDNVVVATPAEGVATPVPVSVPVVKLSWAGLFGGMFVAVGVWLLLTVLGMAVGLSSLEPSDTMHAVKAVGIGEGIWSIIVSIIALFVGGMVASRTSGILDRPAGAIHGAVLWAIATLLTLLLVGGAVRGVVRGALSTAGIAVEVAGQGAGAAGIDPNDVIAPVNDQLRAEGKPPMTAAQAQAVVQGTVSNAIREGRVDKNTFVTALTDNTALTEADARDLADRLDQQISSASSQAAQNLKTGALNAADVVGKAMWWVFVGMILGLVAAVVGSTLGVSRRQRVAAGVERVPLATTHPVHT